MKCLSYYSSKVFATTKGCSYLDGRKRMKLKKNNLTRQTVICSNTEIMQVVLCDQTASHFKPVFNQPSQ